MSTVLPKSKPHKLYNLIIPISLSRRQVLLGYKKRGFGVGKYNGFGGKVEHGESIVASAQRELNEESGIQCTVEQLHHHAVLLLETLADDEAMVLEIHVFVCTEWEGTEIETDEMRPQWFTPETIPLDDMWEETRIWMTTTLKLYLSPSTSSQRWFIHYVDFVGGVNAQTGKWDPWHGMGRSVWQWFDAPVDHWTAEDIVRWTEAVRENGRVGETPEDG